MKITISGRPGAGKSSLKDNLSYALKIPAYSIGDLRGKIAEAHGMDIDSLNKIGETEDWTDKQVDDEQISLGKSENIFILEGRLSWYFIPNSFKIFLNVDERVGAERIIDNFGDGRVDEFLETNVENEIKRLRARVQSDCVRYKKWYNLDFMNPQQSWFDYWIDTTSLSPEQVFKRVIEDYYHSLSKSLTNKKIKKK